ncbi:MAG TPA: DUF4184 family protein [Vicinamibacterales bacterium]|nr:DUF4184 family protein [Vicinamibacterales bacterium]
MPVTPAHTVVAWPLKKIAPALPLSALVIGTMSPDYEYFLRLAPIARVAHQPAGVIFFCLPVSMLAWVVFRRLVRPALVDLFPPGLARALGSPSTSWPLALAAAALGAVSHVAWDGFTHQNDWAVRALPALRTQPLPDLVPLPWYKLLQHASSAVGLILLASWVAAWIRATPPEARAWAAGQRRRTVRVVSTILGVSAACGVADSLMGSSSVLQVAVGRAAVGAMVGCCLSVLVYALMRVRA